MPRLMSVALTEDAVRAGRKTVTRRLGWSMLRPGDELDLCRKVMGRRKGDPLVRVARVRVLSARREPLDAITDEDVLREGFTPEDFATSPFTRTGRYSTDPPNTPALWFVLFFGRHMKCDPDALVTRIEWEYLPRPASWPPL